MTKAELQKLKSQLPKHYAKQIKARTGKSYSSIFKTFHENSDLIVIEVVDAALEILEEEKAKESARSQKLAQLC
ncbi:MAG: hypothetical protein IPN08_15945 [Bacteroidales bacterium]|nr:hypothetical protein [Bacteroidales bacterium]